MTRILIHNINVVTPSQILANATVVVEHGVIRDVATADQQRPSGTDTVIDGNGGTLIPGMIDVHIHGAHGCDMMDGTTESILKVSQALADTGCTSFLATSVTSSLEALETFIRQVKSVLGREPGAKIAGIHLEGPYLNKHRKGMQNEAYLRHPDIAEMETILGWADGLVKMVTIAPELPGGMDMVDYLRGKGIVVSIAHSEATYDEAKTAFKRGASHVTHCFNAMRSIHHREPGVVVAAFEEPHVSCEAIVDNIHLHPAIVRLMHRNLGRDRMVLVTDAMQAMGLGDGAYTFGGHEVHVVDGVARLKDGTLASSTITMVGALQLAIEDGIPLFDAAHMAATTPARELGLGQIGVIESGAVADLVLLTPDCDLAWVMIDGAFHQTG